MVIGPISIRSGSQDADRSPALFRCP